MPDFKNVKDLVKYIEKKAVESVQQRNSETQRTMIDTGKRHVQEDVYDVYEPKVYARSGQLKEDWEIENTENGISMTNTRTDEETGGNVARTVETGKGYTYRFPFSNVPRPFIENTYAELSLSNKLENAVKSDLKKSGLNVE